MDEEGSIYSIADGIMQEGPFHNAVYRLLPSKRVRIQTKLKSKFQPKGSLRVKYRSAVYERSHWDEKDQIWIYKYKETEE